MHWENMRTPCRNPRPGVELAACRGLDPWTLLGLCLRSDMCRGLGSLGPWLDLQGLWARRCSSLGLLHCGCWVVPLRLSPAPLWEVGHVLSFLAGSSHSLPLIKSSFATFLQRELVVVDSSGELISCLLFTPEISCYAALHQVVQ
ncbi:hypothetical protein AMECASPLE_029973 [Ameca splendens]|uniref:Uncharacterized protein n=1 Tax=Ameca splendens TaxID=208324 RepID=A0ABV0Z5F4_9TELE